MSPRIILGVPGTWKDRTDVLTSIADKSEGYLFAGRVIMDLATKQGYELEIHDHDPRLQEAFAMAGRGRVTAETLAQIGNHKICLYLLGSGGSLEAARAMMRVACGLLRAGGLAVKVESAGLAHSPEGWTELAQSEGGLSLYRAYVTLVGGRNHFYSCGMHNLGRRDAAVTADISPQEAAGLLETFLLYTLLEQPEMEMGHTFSVDAKAPRYRLAEEESAFSADNPFYNAYGVWTLSPAGEG